MAPSTPKLFMPVTLGGKSPIQLKHRVAMAPLTRLRTGAEGEPKAVAAEYYSQRTTDGGLIVTEATDISKQGNGYYGAPGLYTQEQVEAWKPVTKAIHEKGGKVFVQLWHTGRVSHPLNQPNGGLPVSASATSMEAVTSHAVTAEGRKDHVTPRALEVDEIPGIVEDYKTATKNALAAGFDGVELHAANGYLLEQFLCDATNKRTDKYGGSIDNRARFLFEAIEGILSVADSSKVAIRLSPYGITFACTDSNPLATYGYVIRKLNDYDLAYVHLVEPNGWHFTGPLVPEGGISPVLRPLYKGVIVAAGGFNREKAIKNVEEGYDDIIAFGRDFIGTPDIVERLKADQPLNEYNTKTFYPRAWTDVLEEGYTDYPFWHEK
ncbi:putative 12-oxophytodienoate reductase 11 [Phytophthora cactorum]|nr:putative 12-oxophytodienoate reductase 11 [Phytophthora cactorum]KAG2804453.1 putative 12-oxophytodienoate reductase 11 [Phytophthora cactorum]KAG2805843.1 putative 12-oxophytodienoate reductase 11 [Phytophthora cactorum]KAG2843297.1 putative 12-oxophytodienoate reductase 11 [Phytophthora cactorum]KAG2884104.1 putative 12-oxophytodienoate reductase 11 [Phytophthora cactorum]